MSLIKLKHKHHQHKKQQGFVLVLALILLAVLTLIGVSSMNSANMELRSTANAQQHQFAFNAMQSLLEFSVSGGSAIDYQPEDMTATQNVTYGSSTATVSHAGCSVGVGSSLEEGKGFSYNFFDIAGSGSNATGTATSTQTQGIRFPAAACN
jgi:Tfp pilus assembly protein PilX